MAPGVQGAHATPDPSPRQGRPPEDAGAVTSPSVESRRLRPGADPDSFHLDLPGAAATIRRKVAAMLTEEA